MRVTPFVPVCDCVSVSSVKRGFTKQYWTTKGSENLSSHIIQSIVFYRRSMAFLLSFTLKDGNMRHLVYNTLLLYLLIRNRWWLLLVILYKLHLHHKIPFQFSLDQQLYNKPKWLIKQLCDISIPLFMYGLLFYK